MKVKRMFEMSEIEQAIIKMIWNDVKDLPVYANYRKYERGFEHENKRYRYRCQFKIENGHLSLINTEIEHEQVVIDIMH
jgi:hypothetical protein